MKHIMLNIFDRDTLESKGHASDLADLKVTCENFTETFLHGGVDATETASQSFKKVLDSCLRETSLNEAFEALDKGVQEGRPKEGLKSCVRSLKACTHQNESVTGENELIERLTLFMSSFIDKLNETDSAQAGIDSKIADSQEK